MATAKGTPAALTQDQVTAMVRQGAADSAVTRIIESHSARHPRIPAAKAAAQAKGKPGAANQAQAAKLDDGKGRVKAKAAASPVRGARPDKAPPGY